MPSTGLPAGTVRRLVGHYGSGVQPWLDQVQPTLAEAARGWGIGLCGYHDAGWTSVVALARNDAGRLVLIKALPDGERYRQERTALLHWQQAEAPVNRLLSFMDSDQLLLLEAVAGLPGGAPRPPDHQRRAAAALAHLHLGTAAVDGPVPLLTDYYLGTVVPRVVRRADRFEHVIGSGNIARCLSLSRSLCARAPCRLMLHADLYAENVLFDDDRHVVFVDPHAKVGSPAFDWAFWCVYYVPTSGFADRIALCREFAPDEFEEALAWSLTLAVDGALYCLETQDDRVSAMLAVLGSQPLAHLSPRWVG